MLICITVHEFSHALTAYRLGDFSVKRAGRLTLNPIKHLDPIGTLLILTVHFGYGKPVMVNPNNLRNAKRDMAVISLAGPASNVAITIIFLVLYGALYIPFQANQAGKYVLDMLYFTSLLSLRLAIFNMIPIPPMDGSKVFFAILDEPQYNTFLRYKRYGGLLLMAVMWTNILGKPLSIATQWSFSQLFPLAEWAYNLVQTIFYH